MCVCVCGDLLCVCMCGWGFVVCVCVCVCVNHALVWVSNGTRQKALCILGLFCIGVDGIHTCTHYIRPVTGCVEVCTDSGAL